MALSNSYDDRQRAQAFARLEFSGTYHLAFRDLPGLLAEHVQGRLALDFGCGTGRSTRFLRQLGFDAIGIDIAPPMIALARAADPSGRYVLIDDGDYGLFQPRAFDLILSTFAFDNIPGVQHRTRILEALGRLLRDEGRIVLVDCTPELYVNEWVSFSTKDFPENRRAGSGEVAYAVFTEVGDRRPVVDFFWFHNDYLELFAASGLDLIAHHQPLGRDDEPYAWVCETSIAPFSIYVLAPTKRSQHANGVPHLGAPR